MSFSQLIQYKICYLQLKLHASITTTSAHFCWVIHSLPAVAVSNVSQQLASVLLLLLLVLTQRLHFPTSVKAAAATLNLGGNCWQSQGCWEVVRNYYIKLKGGEKVGFY